MANILIIDDDEITRTIIKGLLESHGYTVFEASDGKMGVRSFVENAIDLVITDIYMPERDGLETIQELKKILPDVKILVISGEEHLKEQTFFDLGEIAKNFGASQVLSKPIETEAFINSVQKTLSK